MLFVFGFNCFTPIFLKKWQNTKLEKFFLINCNDPGVTFAIHLFPRTLQNNDLLFFCSDSSEKIWCVPITITTSRQPKTVAKRFLLDRKESSESLEGLLKNATFKVNFETTGVYRVLYDNSLLSSVVECAKVLSANDRIGLLDDLFALVSALPKRTPILTCNYILWNRPPH